MTQKERNKLYGARYKKITIREGAELFTYSVGA